ncbi:MAG: NAD(P)-dependent oxidoreductase [Bacteroidales bacterium]|nr:NAD(P)-dependent oxidoreductase [Bacteroidales bacterium]
MVARGSKVLFLDTAHPFLREELTRLGFICDHFPELSPEDYRTILAEYTGIIIRNRIRLDEGLLSCASKLQFIARVGAGIEGIDTDYASRHGIICLNAPEGNRDALAEHTIGMILALFNRLLKADAEVRKGVWDRAGNRGMELMGKTVGIIGYGNMGSAFAQRLKGFQTEVLAWDKYKQGYGNDFVKETTLEELQKQCDLVSLHVPLTSETHNMVDEAFIQSFRKDFFLVNTSRGQVVRTADLVRNLRSGKIRGAVLDVLEWESTTFDRLDMDDDRKLFQELAGHDRVIFSPHVAGHSDESPFKMAKVIIDKIKNEFRL